MKRSSWLGAIRIAGGVLMAAAFLPVIAVGAHAAVVDPSPSSAAYAEQVGIGTAVKIGNPDPGSTVSRVKAAAGDSATPDATAVATNDVTGIATSTPSGAVVVEIESHQAAAATDTSVAVLGTKVGSTTDELANTGAGRVSGEALIALLLLAAGLLLRDGPRLWDAAQTANARRH